MFFVFLGFWKLNGRFKMIVVNDRKIKWGGFEFI